MGQASTGCRLGRPASTFAPAVQMSRPSAWDLLAPRSLDANEDVRQLARHRLAYRRSPTKPLVLQGRKRRGTTLRRSLAVHQAGHAGRIGWTKRGGRSHKKRERTPKK